MANRTRIRLLIAILLVVGALVAFVWALSRRSQTEQVAVVQLPPVATSSAVPAVAEPSLAVPSPVPSVEPTVELTTPSPVTESTPQTAATPEASPAAPDVSATSLLIPVEGVRASDLRDTFQASRSEGRVHDAIDIPAPRGTPVLAATDGRIVKLFQSVPGGITLYQLATDNRTILYYAHLERYADGLKDGQQARRGETIAYVGDTGNATPGNYHLHFQVYRITDPKHFWDGENLNPYGLLR